MLSQVQSLTPSKSTHDSLISCNRKDLSEKEKIYSQYIPKIPKNPKHALATNKPLTPLFPSGKSSTPLHHIHAVQNIAVRPCLANRIWNGCMPSPSNSRTRVVAFMRAPKSWEKVTRKRPWFCCQKPRKRAFHVLGLLG